MADLVIADRQVMADVFIQIIREHIARNAEHCDPMSYFNADFDMTKYRECMEDADLLNHKYGIWLKYAHGYFEPTESERRLIPHFPANKVQEVMNAKRDYDANIYDYQTRSHYHKTVIHYWTRYKK